VWRGHCQEAKRGQPRGHRITRNCKAIESFLLPYAPTGLCLITVWCLIGATPRGQLWTPAVALPHGRDGLSARHMAVLCPCPMPSMYRHVPHQFMRNKLYNFTAIVSVTVYYQGGYVETYSRYNEHGVKLSENLAIITLSGHNGLFINASAATEDGESGTAPVCLQQKACGRMTPAG